MDRSDNVIKRRPPTIDEKQNLNGFCFDIQKGIPSQLAAYFVSNAAGCPY